MLYYLLLHLRNAVVGFNVFRYITFRTAWAAITALLISFILGPWLIERMRQIKLGQYIREEGPKSHQQKAGTPTMGGILINIAIFVPTILWADILNPYIWIVLFVTLAFGAIGFVGGIFGLGAGFANVPALNLLMAAPLKVAVGSSGLLISVINSSAAWVYLHRGALLPLVVVPSILGVMLGSRIGARLLGATPAPVVRRLVIVVMLLAGGRALSRGLGIWV